MIGETNRAGSSRRGASMPPRIPGMDVTGAPPRNDDSPTDANGDATVIATRSPTEPAHRTRDQSLEDQIEVLPKGRLLIRAICMVFDHYLVEAQSEPRFSKVI